MTSDRYLLRKADGSGSGVIFKTRKEVDRFLKENDGYVEESAEETSANQRAADEEVKAQAQSEDKAVRPAQNKAR